MNKYISILSLFFLSTIVYSQNDSILINRLNKVVVNCETVAYNSQSILPEYDFSQIDSINQILSIWENECGNVEPIIRLKILLNIKQKTFKDTAYENYITHYIYIFRDRISATKRDNYNEIFEYYKSYYSYVPLNSEFDKWTKKQAEALLSDQIKGTSEYLFCLLFSEKTDLFYEELKSREYKNNFVKTTVFDEIYETWQKGMVYNAIIGAWIPIGNLSNTFSLSPNIGFRAGFTFKNSMRFDIGVNVRIHVNNKPFEINADNTITSVNSSTGITGGLWFTKEYRLKNKLMIDAIGGIGIGTLDTDLKKVNPNPDNDNSDYYSITTADFSLGMNIRKRIFIKHSIGINISYHFAPYNLDDKLVNNIGSQFLTTNLIYRF